MAAPRIGDAADLLRGVRSDWRPEDPWPLQAPPDGAITTFPADPDEVEDGVGRWESSVLSAHDDLASLAGAALGVVVAPFAGVQGHHDVSAGALMGDEALAATAEWLGVPSGTHWSWLLAAVHRDAGTAAHEVLARPRRRGFERDVHVTEQGRRGERTLRPGPRPHAASAKRLTAASAQRYLDHMSRFGTHFVSAVRWGDTLLQALAIERDALEALRASAAWDDDEPSITGTRALAMAAAAGRGGRAGAGTIRSRGGDPELLRQLDRGDWQDPRTGADSLLAPFSDGRDLRLLAELRHVAPIGFELTPLNRFMEFYRAHNWQRLLVGALRARYGTRVRLPVGDGAGEEAGGGQVAGQSLLRPPPRRSQPASTDTLLHGERLVASDLEIRYGSSRSTVLGDHLELAAGQTVRVPGGALVLAVRRVVAHARSSAEAPRIFVDDDAFEDCVLLADEVDGILVLADASGERERVVAGGVVLARTGDGVVVDGVTYQSESIEARVADALATLLPLSLRTAERLLASGASDEAQSALAWTSLVAEAVGAAAVARRAQWLLDAADEYGGRWARRSSAERDHYVRVVLAAAADAEHAASDAAEPDRTTLTAWHAVAAAAHETFWYGDDDIDSVPAVPPDPALLLADLRLLRAHALVVHHQTTGPGGSAVG